MLTPHSPCVLQRNAKHEAAIVAEQSLKGRGQAQRAARQLDIQDKHEQFKLNTQVSRAPSPGTCVGVSEKPKLIPRITQA